MSIRRRDELARELAALTARVLEGPGVVPAAERLAAARGALPEGAIGAFLAKVRDHAYRITAEEVAALRAAGWADDVLFELTIAAALGAAEARLLPALDALAAAHDARPRKTGGLA